MGKPRRRFEIGFKRQVVEEIEAGLVTTAEVARKYEVSQGAIDRWKEKYRRGTLVEKPSTEERRLQAENEKLKAKVGDANTMISATSAPCTAQLIAAQSK